MVARNPAHKLVLVEALSDLKIMQYNAPQQLSHPVHSTREIDNDLPTICCIVIAFAIALALTLALTLALASAGPGSSFSGCGSCCSGGGTIFFS
jgi:hypothetical protein